MATKIISKYNFGYLKYIVSGAWIICLYFFFLSLVFFSLCVYQFQRDVEKILIDIPAVETQEIFVPHKCNITSLKDTDRNISAIVEVPCIKLEASTSNKSISALEVLKSQAYNSILYKAEIKASEEIISKLETDIKQEGLGKMDMMVLKGNLHNEKLKLNEHEEDLNHNKNFESVLKNLEQESRFYERLFPLLTNEGTPVWATPGILLSILLSLAMGGLGSLVTVTIEYLKINSTSDDNVNYSMYVFRPMLGAITALVAYIVVKSGQVSISGADVSELSPFFLSFIAVIAGLMSEQVYRELIKRGSTILEGAK